MCYLAMGLPAVIAGVLAVYGGGVVVAGQEYSAAVLVLTALALLGVVWTGDRQTAGRRALTPQFAVD
jgi:hypothetical protein